MLLTEKYRPKSLSDFSIDDHIRSYIDKAIKAGKMQHTIFYGSSGTGKSSIIQYLCNSIADDVLVINASEERGIDVIREKILPFASSVSFTDKLKIVDFREADQLTRDSQKALNDIIEEYSNTTIFLFSTNDIHKIIDSIKSRCVRLNINGGSTQQCLNVIKKIVTNENIKIDKEQAKEIVIKNHPDIRKMINDLQQGLDENNTYIPIEKRNETEKLYECISVLQEKINSDNEIYQKYIQIRHILNTFDQMEIDNSFRFLTEHIEDMFKKDLSRMESVIIISEYMYRNSVNLDKLVNLSTLFLQLLKIKKEDA